MPSNWKETPQTSTALQVFLIAAAWLVLISGLHYHFNYESTGRIVVRMGYMPVITNLAAALLDYASRESKGIRFEAMKFSSFSEMAESLRNGNIEAAFIIAPLAIVLHQQNAEVKIVYIGNRHESTFVYRNDLKVKSFADLVGKSIAVPMRYSGHNIAIKRLAEKFGMTGPALNLVEMNPPDMPAALAVGALDAYFVGEPFAAKSVTAGDAEPLFYVEQVWPDFICNLMIVRRDYINRYPERVQSLVQGAVRSGLWAKDNQAEAARIVSGYWNQSAELIQYSMNTPPNRIVYNKYTPQESEIQYLADLMVKYDLLKSADIAGLVDASWAGAANVSAIMDFRSVLQAPRSN